MVDGGTPTSYRCTRCRNALLAHKVRKDHFFHCPKCEEMVIPLSTLCLMIQSNHVLKLEKLMDQSTSYRGSCAICRAPTAVIDAPTLSGHCELTGCRRCRVLTFDRGELAQAPKINHPKEKPLRDFAVGKLVDEREVLASMFSSLMGLTRRGDWLSLFDF